MKRIGPYRCFVIVFIFLTADILNWNYFPAGRYTWLVYPASALLALPFYRLCAHVCAFQRQGSRRLVSPLYFLLTTVMAGGILGQLYHFVNVNNDFDMNYPIVAASMAATALWLCSRKNNAFFRYADIAFGGMVFCLGIFFLTAVDVGDLWRLLPLYDGAPRAAGAGLWKLFLLPFGQGFMAIAWLSERADEQSIKKGAMLAAVAAALLLAGEQVKNISTIGYEIASQMTFPSYAVAGVKRLGSYGMHIEEVLVCGLLLGRVVKLGVLMDFGGGSLSMTWKRLDPLVGTYLAAAGAAALGVWVMGSARGTALWTEIAYIPIAVMCVAVPLLAAAFFGLKSLLAKKRPGM